MPTRKGKTDQPLRLWMKRSQEASALYEIFEQSSSSEPGSAVLQRIVEQISAATRIPIVAVELYDEESKTMSVCASTGADHSRQQTAPASKTLSGSVVQTRTPIIAANPSRGHKAEFWVGHDAKTVACFPILAASRCLGSLTLAHPEWAELRPDLQSWAAGVAMFIGSFLMWRSKSGPDTATGLDVDECVKVLRSIQDLAIEARSSEDLDEFFRALHQKLNQMIRVEDLYFAVYNAVNHKVSLQYFSDLLQADSDQREYVDHDYIRSIAETGQPLHLPNQAWLGVPVRSAAFTTGALVMYSYDPEVTYGSRERALLEYAAGVIGSVLDRKQIDQALRSNSIEDDMTQLPGPSLFRYLLNQTLARARRNKELLAVLNLDLDHFKKFRKENGERVASSVIKQIAGRLKRNTREGDTLARWGDDRFIWEISSLQRIDDVALIAEKLLAIVSHPVYVEGQEHSLTTSIGISLFPYDAGDLDPLIRYSEDALIRAKEMGRNMYQFYTGELNAQIAEQLASRRQVEEALRQHEFIPYYQPVVSVTTGKITSVEALARWKNAEGRIAYPEDFLSVSEDNGLTAVLDEWVLRSACLWAARPAPFGAPQIRVSVNLSSEIFRRTDFVELVSRILDETHLNPDSLQLEVSEQTLREDPGKSLERLQALRNAGIHLCIDGFGGGVPVALLKNIQYYKIDSSLIQSARKTLDTSGLSPIVSLAHSLSAQVIAKGVETIDDLEFIRSQRCDGYQGNYFSPPVSAEEYENRWGRGLEKTEVVLREVEPPKAKKTRVVDETERLPWPVSAALPEWAETSIPVDLTMEPPVRSAESPVSAPSEPAPRLKLYSFPGEPQRAKFPEAKDYFVLCATCGNQFDALITPWCFCLVSERTLTCPRCNTCFCNASLEYKLDFWTNAPQGMWDRRIAEEKEHQEMQSNPKPEEVVRPLVLVVDDEPQVRKTAMRSISELGYGVVVAGNGAEGLEMAREYLPDFVLSDALMPKMDGREMCKLLKKDARLRKTKVVIMTALSTRSRDKLAAFREFGMDDYVQKPLDFTALRQLLEKYLGAV